VTSTRPGELSTGIAILGLLVTESDTIAGLGTRLQVEHPGGRWPRNAAHMSVPALADSGFVRVARPGRERSLDLYEPTPAGLTHFDAWLRRPITGLPAQRDALRAKLRYADSEELVHVAVRELLLQEDLCRRAGEAAVTRYTTARSLPRTGAAVSDVRRASVREALAADEASGWYERARALKRLREQLQRS
jgi:hypothetical protein